MFSHFKHLSASLLDHVLLEQRAVLSRASCYQLTSTYRISKKL